jgi:hypothetical protein
MLDIVLLDEEGLILHMHGPRLSDEESTIRSTMDMQLPTRLLLEEEIMLY